LNARKKIIKTKVKYQKQKKHKQLKDSDKTIKSNSNTQKKETPPDPLSPFAILKSLKVK